VEGVVGLSFSQALKPTKTNKSSRLRKMTLLNLFFMIPPFKA